VSKKDKPAKPDPDAVPSADQSAGESCEDAASADVLGAEELAADVAAAIQKQPGNQSDQLRKELAELKDRVLRAQAELENFRKRAARELQDAHRYANLPLMRDLLPVLDNVDRAIESAEQNHDTASLLEGVKMVARQSRDVLERYHCVRIADLHEPFDPNLHEAISQQPSDEHPAGTVVLVTQTGFQLHDRVVRPSQVIVSTAVKEEEE